MVTDLKAVKEALEGLTDIELRALKVAASEAPRVRSSVLAWIEGACDWDMSRRAGRHYELLPPAVAIAPSENGVTIQATHVLRASFASSDLAPAALMFFDALVQLLTARGDRDD